MAGRPREFRNAAEKQKAYRERKKQDETGMQEALQVFRELEEEKVTKLNYLRYLEAKGKKTVIEVCDGYVKILVDGYANSSMSVYLANHLIRQGFFEFIKKDWFGSQYRIIGEKNQPKTS